jgi:glycogen operon protein
MVSYNGKHNEDNGEENRDGNDNNYSYNYGSEGATIDPVLEGIRERQLKNFFATLLISLGTPMILGGDEIGRTQNGNNNAYCQDNEISWYDWSLVEKNKGLFRFVKEMIAFRLRHPGFMRPEFYTGREGNYNATPDISWYNEKGPIPDWDRLGYNLALQVNGSQADVARDKDVNDFYIMFNAGLDPVVFSIPSATSPGHKRWFRAVDTSMSSPKDILPAGSEEPLEMPYKYRVKARSMAILVSKAAI